MRRLKVLLSAYACEPGQGSEAGVGWNVALHVARYHDVLVITRENNRPVIEAALADAAGVRPRFVYFDLPPWARWWKRRQRGVQLYYYLWQLGAYFVARRLHRAIRFDLVHHVTFVKYWAPSFGALLSVPFLWGPVGGGESSPRHLWPELGARGQSYEWWRELARALGERDPLVRFTAHRSTIALAATPQTGQRLRILGVKSVYMFSQAAISREEFLCLSANHASPDRPYRFVSIGRLLPLKGFHWGLRAFARAGLPDWEYLVIGGGPDEERLRTLAGSLHIDERVHFLGSLRREEVFSRLRDCDVLVHPSLHDSGGWVCVEAMAAGKPVVCLDLGGPALAIGAEAGVIIPAAHPGLADRLATAMTLLARNHELRRRLGEMGRRRVLQGFLWEGRARQLASYYVEVVANHRSDGGRAWPLR